MFGSLCKLTRGYKRTVNLQTMSPKVLNAEYGVMGDVVIRAEQIEREMQAGKKFPFSHLTYCNLGDPQSLEQPPLSFLRQVISLAMSPSLMDRPAIAKEFPQDAIERARYLLGSVGGSLGVYSSSQGTENVRKSIARFIAERDSTGPVDPSNILLTNGASTAAEIMFSMICHSNKDGILIPIPQYPLFNALVSLKGASAVPYYLDSVHERWVLNVESMQKSLDKSKRRGIHTRALVVINPGNPTGQVLSYENLVDVVAFCEHNNVLLLADEVYQNNVYRENAKFISMRKVAIEQKSAIEIASLYSISKGFLGECGLRGGYLEAHNFDEAAKAQLVKMGSIKGTNTIGQLAMEISVNPPKADEESYPQYAKERDFTMGALKRKSVILYQRLNQMTNIQCNHVDGAMYAFPEVKFSARAIEAAQKQGLPVDKFYVFEALEATGIVIVPGSGFGQKPGTYHFRITCLAPEDQLGDLLDRFSKFNDEFHQKYA